MKIKIIYIILVVTVIVSIPSAWAATKCVKLDASKSCKYDAPGAGTSNWTTTCDGVAISGVSYCGNQDGGTRGTKSESVTISYDNVEDNKYCWCKMTGPAVSSWVFSDARDSAALCAQNCVYGCAGHAAYYYDFRSALFSDLGI